MKKLTNKILTLALAAAPALAFGQNQPPQARIGSVDDILRIVDRIINILGGLFFAAAVIYIFFAAYLYLTAAGDPEKLTKAKNQLIYAIIGIAVGLVAFSVTTIVQRFING